MSTAHIFQLSNNLTVIHAHRPDIDSVALNLTCRAGSMYELEDEIGVAHLLEHVSLERTKKYPAKGAAYAVIENIGGFSGAGTDRDTIHYKAKVLAREIESAFEYLSEVVVNPLLPDDRISNEKKIVEQEIQRAQHDYSRITYEACLSDLYEKDRMGTSNLGKKKTIKNIDREALLNFRKRHFKSQNMVLSICGNIDLPKAQRLSEKYFSEVTKGGLVKRNRPAVSTTQTLKIIKKTDATQSHLTILYPAFSISAKQLPAFELLRSAFSTGKKSRLFKAVREQHGLAYEIRAPFASWTIGGEFWIYTAVSEEKVNKVIEVLGHEIHHVIKKGFTKKEIERAKNTVLTNYTFWAENPLNLSSLYATKYLLGGDTHPDFRKEMERYLAITPEDIASVAHKLFVQGPKISIVSKTLKKSDVNIAPLLHTAQ